MLGGWRVDAVAVAAAMRGSEGGSKERFVTDQTCWPRTQRAALELGDERQRAPLFHG